MSLNIRLYNKIIKYHSYMYDNINDISLLIILLSILIHTKLKSHILLYGS